MIRILQSVNIMDRAGLETMLMNYYRNIDRSIVQFDFLTHRPYEGAYDEEIKKMGGKVYHAPRLYPHNIPKYYKYMRKFYNEHPEYMIVHSHMDSMSYYPLKAAKKNAVPIRIAHSHSSKLDRDLKLPIKYYALKSIHTVANQYCACGKVAGQFMFCDEPFTIIHNAIDLEKFAFDNQKREQIRKTLGINNQLVLGHVGRYCYIKNQLFLLDIFKEVLKYEPDSLLILVGKGPDEQKIVGKAESLGLKENIMLLIDRSDVDQLYQAFDVFVMPSLFEGLPVVGVEAQANGLPVLVSDQISSEILIAGNTNQIPLRFSAEEWARQLLKIDRTRNGNASTELQMAGYDIKAEAKKMQQWYIDLFEKINR